MRALFTRQFAVFVTGGGLSALIDIGAMLLLLRSGANLTAATSTGFILGLAVNYGFHARMTFRADPSTGSVLRFLTIVAINYLITLAIVLLVDGILGSPLVGKLISIPIVAVNGFLLSKHWVFR
jgi:putative flippase GtrA